MVAGVESLLVAFRDLAAQVFDGLVGEVLAVVLDEGAVFGWEEEDVGERAEGLNPDFSRTRVGEGINILFFFFRNYAAQVAIVKEMTGRNRAAKLEIVKQMSRQ